MNDQLTSLQNYCFFILGANDVFCNKNAMCLFCPFCPLVSIHHVVIITNLRLPYCNNPRPAGVWIVTRPAGGGGGAQRTPLRSPKLLDRCQNFKTPFDSPVRERFSIFRFSQRTRKMNLKHFLKRQNRPKNIIRKNHGKVPK